MFKLWKQNIWLKITWHQRRLTSNGLEMCPLSIQRQKAQGPIVHPGWSISSKSSKICTKNKGLISQLGQINTRCLHFHLARQLHFILYSSPAENSGGSTGIYNATVHWQTHSTGGQDCMCDHFLLPHHMGIHIPSSEDSSPFLDFGSCYVRSLL